MDVERALKTLGPLGSGCSVFKNEYVCTVPFSLSDDSAELMGVAEEVRNILSICILNIVIIK